MCYLGLLHLQACYPAENKNLIVRYTWQLNTLNSRPGIGRWGEWAYTYLKPNMEHWPTHAYNLGVGFVLEKVKTMNIY